MILGRHPNLWLGFLTAAWNVIFLGGWLPGITDTVFAAVNILLAAGVALVAGNASITIDAGRAALRREAANGHTTNAPR